MSAVRGTTVVGSKAIGLAVAEAVREHEPSARILTFDDRGDSRSVFGALAPMAEVIDPKSLDLDGAERVVVAGWYWRVPSSTPARPILGLHNSLLPTYRGGSPLVWAMIRGEREVGVSLFELGDRMDAGPVWGQLRTEVGPDDTIAEVGARLEVASVELVRDYLAGRLTPTEQDEAAASYCAQRDREDGRIDWHWPAQRVHDFVRAQTRPYPGAFYEVGYERFPVWRTRIRPGVVYGEPGREYRGAVICGDERAVEILDPA